MAEEPNIFSASYRKLALFPEHLQEWQQGKLPTPITLEIQPSERCNHGCPNCQAQFATSLANARRLAKKGSFIDLAILESVWRKPPQGIVISGNSGDPLLHPQIDELLREVRSRNVPCVLITNGELMTKGLAELAVECCAGIRVSLDAHDDDSFRATHGRKANWSKVVDGIRNLVVAKSRSSGANCKIGVGYLTGERPLEEAEQATLLARMLGVDYIQIRPLHFSCLTQADFLDGLKRHETEVFSVLLSSHKYDSGLPNQPSYSSCHGANFYCVVDAQADVYICCHHVGRQGAAIGTLRQSSWEQIIESEQRRQVMSRFPNRTCIPNCRLDSINRWLESGQSGNVTLSADDLSAEVIEHAAFL